MELQKVKTVEIIPTTPFDFDSTFHKPDHFPSGDNDWQEGVKWQTWRWPAYAKASAGNPAATLGLKFIDQGTVEEPKIKLEIYSKNSLSENFVNSLVKEIRYKYNLDLELTDFYQEFRTDKILGPIIKRWKGMRPGHQGSLYEYLIIGIVLQNAQVKRSINMLQSLFDNYGKLVKYDDKQLCCFWQPGGLMDVDEQELRDLKIGYRAKSIKRIDEHFANNKINEFELRKKEFQTQKEELLNLYGVGPATVWYLLFDVFHHYDFFEHISPWEQKIYSKLFFDQDPEDPVSVEKLIDYFDRYQPYQQLAVHYIWEDLWWKRKNTNVPWLEKLIRI